MKPAESAQRRSAGSFWGLFEGEGALKRLRREDPWCAAAENTPGNKRDGPVWA